MYAKNGSDLYAEERLSCELSMPSPANQKNWLVGRDLLKSDQDSSIGWAALRVHMRGVLPHTNHILKSGGYLQRPALMIC